MLSIAGKMFINFLSYFNRTDEFVVQRPKNGNLKKKNIKIQYITKSVSIIDSVDENAIVESVTNRTNIEIKIDETAFPSLYVGIVFGFGEVVEALIQNGSDVNFNEKNGWLPLNTAAAFGELISQTRVEIYSIHFIRPGRNCRYSDSKRR